MTIAVCMPYGTDVTALVATFANLVNGEEAEVAYGRVSMRKTREILRLKFEARLSHRQIGRACGVSCSTVSDAVGRFQAAGLCWPLPAELPDSALEARLYRAHGEVASDTREPDWEHVHAELARAHVTLAALWGEYKQAHPDGYQYSWFCAAYRVWAAKIDVVMRFRHKAGEKLFVDWAGDTVPIVDRASGEVRPAIIGGLVLSPVGVRPSAICAGGTDS